MTEVRRIRTCGTTTQQAADAKSVREAMAAHGQRYTVRAGRDVLQSKVSTGDSLKASILRVFVDVDRQPAEVVTAYRSSKVEKYWRKSR